MIVGTVAFSESILNDLKPSMGAQASKTQPALSQQPVKTSRRSLVHDLIRQS